MDDIYIEFVPFNSALIPIKTPWYLSRDTEFQHDNILLDCEGSTKYDIPKKLMASWALARFYFLFGDNLWQALNIGYQGFESHVGLQDGGTFYAEGQVKSGTHEVIGHIHFQGFGDINYADLSLLECSDQYFPDEIMQQLCNLIWEAPFDLKPCHIIIQDPEQNCKEFHYGWDGKEYF